MVGTYMVISYMGYRNVTGWVWGALFSSSLYVQNKNTEMKVNLTNFV
jgi:hypothetical protein